MGDVTRVLSGLEDFEVTGAVEVAGTLAEMALDEPPTGFAGDGEFALTSAQIACLVAHGIEVSGTAEVGESIGIPQNVADECVAAADHSDGASP